MRLTMVIHPHTQTEYDQIPSQSTVMFVIILAFLFRYFHVVVFFSHSIIP